MKVVAAVMFAAIFGAVQAKNQSECARYFHVNVTRNASMHADFGGYYVLTDQEVSGEPVYQRVNDNRCAYWGNMGTEGLDALALPLCADVGGNIAGVPYMTGNMRTSCKGYGTKSSYWEVVDGDGAASVKFVAATEECPECRTANGVGNLTGDYFLENLYDDACSTVTGSDYCSYTNSAGKTFCFEENGQYSIDFETCANPRTTQAF